MMFPRKCHGSTKNTSGFMARAFASETIGMSVLRREAAELIRINFRNSGNHLGRDTAELQNHVSFG